MEDLLTRSGLAVSHLLESKFAALRTLEVHLDALGPKQILQRGYAVVRHKDGPVLARAADASPGDMLTLTLSDGSMEAEARSIDTTG